MHADGLEHDATGYFIEREVIDARRSDGLWEWPLQMAQKRWCAPDRFEAAFRGALAQFGIGADLRLEHSFGVAGESVSTEGSAGFHSLADLVETPAARASARRAIAARPVPSRIARRSAPAARRLVEIDA